MLSLLSSWATTISLVFGGCCSNAITLEQLTLRYPNTGSLLTFFQFLVISLHGLPKFLIWTRFGPRFRPRRVPISRYILQVAAFYLISLLNNAAFAYRIPMAVHIIFRSGGLMISLLLGWLVSKKRYTITQILSVILVTLGVITTTLSAQSTTKKSANSPADPYVYATGIGILTVALVLSGFLGLLQDWTYAKYGRPTLTNAPSSSGVPSSPGPASWQESLFYLHFLALPMFFPLLPDLAAQMHTLNSTGPRAELNIPIPVPLSANLTTAFPIGFLPPYSLPTLPLHIFRQSANASLVSITQNPSSNNMTASAGFAYPVIVSFSIPQIYLPLILNTITQLICAAGVNRLTTGVSALTVTLVLVVRKAVSLVISVIGVSQVGLAVRRAAFRTLVAILDACGFHVPRGAADDGDWSFNVFGVNVDAALGLLGTAFVGPDTKTKPPQEVDNRMMWTGAALVLLGTVGYTIGSSRPPSVREKQKSKTE